MILGGVRWLRPKRWTVAAIKIRLGASDRFALVLYIRGKGVVSPLLGAEVVVVGDPMRRLRHRLWDPGRGMVSRLCRLPAARCCGRQGMA
jgi:hypothetical protein